MDMADNATYIPKALKEVFSHVLYLIGAILFSFLIFTIVILIPVGRYSFAALYYQATGLDSNSLYTISFFSILAGILFSMNLYLLKKTHEDKGKATGGSIISILSSFIAGIFGSSVCIACVTIVAGFLGIPVTTALISYRRELFLVSALISLVSIYFVSKAIAEHGKCKICIAPMKKKIK